MTAREIIAMLRENRAPVALLQEELATIADLMEDGLDMRRELVSGESLDLGDGWRQIPGPGEVSEEETAEDVAILLRAGEIERDPENPRRVRFVQQAQETPR